MPTFNEFYSVKNFDDQDIAHKKLRKKRLYYLSPEATESFNKKIAQYDYIQYMGTEITENNIETFRQEFEKIVKANTKEKEIDDVKQLSKSSDQLSELKSFVQSYKNYRVNAANFLAGKTYHEKLSQPTIWQEWEDSLAKKDQKFALRSLKRQWEKQGRFFYYTNEGLLHSVEFLRLLHVYILDAKQELEENNDCLTQNEHQKYFGYLQAMLQQIETEKKALTQAMYARLEVACNSGDASYDEVVVDLDRSLRRLEIMLNVKPRITASSHTLTPQTIVRFYECIEDNGSVKQVGIDEPCSKLKSLSWFKDDSNLQLRAVRYAGTVSFIPESFQTLVPEKPSRLVWLFTGHHKRFHYFRNQQQLILDLASLKKLSISKPTEKIISENPLWSKLEKQLKDVKQGTDDAKKESAKSSWFQKKTKSFFDAWEIELLRQQQNILQNQMDFLSTVLPKAIPIEHLFGDKPYFPPETRMSISVILTTLDSDLANLSVNLDSKKAKLKIQSPQYLALQQFMEEQERLIQRYRGLNKKLTGQINDDNQIEVNNSDNTKAVRILKRFANGDTTLTGADVDQVISFHDQLTFNKEQSTDFIRDNVQLFNDSQTVLENILKTYHATIDENEASNKITVAFHYIKLLRNLSLSINSETLDKAVDQFLANFKKFVCDQTKTSLIERFEKIEKQFELVDHLLHFLLRIGINVEKKWPEFFSIKEEQKKKMQYSADNDTRKINEQHNSMEGKQQEVEPTRPPLQEMQKWANGALSDATQLLEKSEKSTAEFKTTLEHHETSLSDKKKQLEAMFKRFDAIRSPNSDPEFYDSKKQKGVADDLQTSSTSPTQANFIRMFKSGVGHQNGKLLSEEKSISLGSEQIIITNNAQTLKSLEDPNTINTSEQTDSKTDLTFTPNM